MKKSMLDEAVRLTREGLDRFWQGDGDFTLDLCAPDVIWIGAQEEQFCKGLDAMATEYGKILEQLIPCYLADAEFQIAKHAARTCTVVGRYLTTTDERSAMFLQVPQRCTTCWEVFDGKLRITHQHISNPIGEMKRTSDESMVREMGELSRRLMERRFTSQLSSQQIVVRARDGVTYYVPTGHIVCVEAEGKHSKLYTDDKTIPACDSFGTLVSRLPAEFAPVQRSFVVNLDRVRELLKRGIVLSNGMEIPIPARRLAEVRNLMRGRYEGSTYEDECVPS